MISPGSNTTASVRRGRPPAELALITRCSYDGDGAMVKSLITSTQCGVVTTFYPGRHYTKKVSSSGEKISHGVRLRRKYYSAGTTLVAVRTVQGGTDTVQWLLSDHLNSTSVTANFDGTLNSEIRYSAFGEIRFSNGITPTQYRYTGQLEQPSIGLDYYVARWYDPALGRFVQPDSIIPDPAKAKAYDRFAYVENNPCNSNDPSGHCIDGLTTIPCLMALIAITGFAGGAAIHEFNESGQSWWESPQDALDTFKAGMDGFVMAVGAALTAGTAAAMVPDYAMKLGSITNNTSIFSWGTNQKGLGTSTSVIGSTLSKNQSLDENGEKNTYVYNGNINGKKDYVGITNDPARRKSQHGARFDFLEIITEKPVTRIQARAIEQTIIESNPDYQNWINSISKNNPIYNSAIQWGSDWVRNNLK